MDTNVMTIEPHPCTYPPQLLGRCIHCGTTFIRGEHGAISRGYCSFSCEDERLRPHPDTVYQYETPIRGDKE